MSTEHGQGPYQIRVVIVDDHALLRQSLRAILQSRPEVEVIGEFSNGREAVDGIPKVRPDVVLMDAAMPRLNGIEATRHLMREMPRLRVIILSAYVDSDQLRDALRAGAAGYLLKRSDIDEVILALQTVYRGNTYFSSGISSRYDLAQLAYEARTPSVRTGMNALSEREREVLQLIVEGRTAAQIAQELFITSKTVEGHKTRIFEKLNVSNRSDLIRLSLKNGLVSDDLAAMPTLEEDG